MRRVKIAVVTVGVLVAGTVFGKPVMADEGPGNAWVHPWSSYCVYCNEGTMTDPGVRWVCWCKILAPVVIT